SFLAVTGKSGVGKSTLLRSLIGLNPLRAGEVSWQGENCLNRPAAKSPFGIMFQKDNVFEHLTVEQNLAFGLAASGKLNTIEQETLIEAARRFDLSGQLNQVAASLSGGQQQRVALARVFLQNKPVLLLDEPFASLDPALRQDGLKWVLELQREQGTTIIMVTHHLNEVAHAAQLLYEGFSASNWQLSGL
ncbi:ATP-binding cassette domain-containing protein, partial [Reinekea sp.]